jgi:hypothetical protein
VYDLLPVSSPNRQNQSDLVTQSHGSWFSGQPGCRRDEVLFLGNGAWQLLRSTHLRQKWGAFTMTKKQRWTVIAEKMPKAKGSGSLFPVANTIDLPARSMT